MKKKKSSTKQDMVIFTTFWQLLGFRKAEKKNKHCCDFSRWGWTQPTDFAFSSRAALPLRNVDITKTQICCYTTLLQMYSIQHTHTSATTELSPQPPLLSLSFSSLRKWLLENLGLVDPPLSFKERGQSSCGTDPVLYFQGPSVVWCPLRTEAWVGGWRHCC